MIATKQDESLNNSEQRLDTKRIVLYCLNGAMFLVSASYALYCGFVADPRNRLLSCIGMMAVSVAPFLVEKLFRFRFTFFSLIFLDAFVIAAGFLGGMFAFYGRFNNYDNLMHGIFGYVGSLAALFILCRLKETQNLRPATVVLFCFAFSMMCGAMWEILEYIGDTFLGQTAQGSADAEGFVDLSDTMTDIIMNFIGAVAFAVHYILHKTTKKDLLMGSILRDFQQ